MNNYSFLQQQWHRLILSSQLVKETTFDIEKTLFLKKTNTNNSDKEHIFISGLARSGTTALLNALHASKDFSSLTYNDMPFVLAPNLWNKITPNNRHNASHERAHKDGVMISTNSPEGLEEVFWSMWKDRDEEIETAYSEYISLILQRYNKTRYLSKNNQNIHRIQLIQNIFPKAIFLIPYRNPLQHAYSLYTQHLHFIELNKTDSFIADYMKWTGHTEFGKWYRPAINSNLRHPNDTTLNHWLEQWQLVYNRIFTMLPTHQNIQLVCYEDLCDTDKVWAALKNLCKVPGSINCNFKASATKQMALAYEDTLYQDCLSLYKQLQESSAV